MWSARNIYVDTTIKNKRRVSPIASQKSGQNIHTLRFWETWDVGRRTVTSNLRVFIISSIILPLFALS